MFGVRRGDYNCTDMSTEHTLIQFKWQESSDTETPITDWHNIASKALCTNSAKLKDEVINDIILKGVGLVLMSWQ
tara:strand:+ start:60 stop:284 length:225 start_codon:yes stop_codon:yes gene_type:complete